MLMKALRKLSVVVMMLAVLMSIMPATTQAASSFNEYYYGSNFYFKVYVPSGYVAGTKVPLMVMLHGCAQNPNDFAAGTKMNALAEQKNAIVLYPEMNVYANSSMCWNWFYDYNQHRGAGGEPEIIKGMVDWVKTNYSVDSNKVYVAGISAGAAMATIMGATYPEVFHAIGISAGVPYDATDNAAMAGTVMMYGTGAPNTIGYEIYQEMASNKHRMPFIVFHGTSDTTVYPVNASEVITSWLNANDYIDDGIDNDSVKGTYSTAVNGAVTGGRSYTKYSYVDKSGVELGQYYKVTGMTHAWSGGSSAGSYTDPLGPDATTIMWNFFTSH